ncbi:MAG: hypothetical protein FWC62_09200, partial [Firmicutes bacterium]|nr:hypothetical protein [Bacillota bacterium]
MAPNEPKPGENPVNVNPVPMEEDPWGWQQLLAQPQEQPLQSPYVQPPAPQPQIQQQPPAPRSPYAQQQESKKRKKWPFFLGGGLLLLCALFSAGFLAYRGAILTHTETVWGPVGSRTESKYTLFGRELLETSYYPQTPDGAGGVSSTATFDANNVRLQEKYYDPDGAYTGRADFMYDENGVFIGKTGYGADGVQAWAETYTYDAGGNRIKMLRQDSLGSTETDYGANGMETDIYSYNANGNMTEEIHYSNSAAFSVQSSRQTYTYAGDGSLLTSDSYGPDDKLQTETAYGPDGAVYGRTDYSYDSGGNLSKTSHYDAANRLLEEDDYDASGAVTARQVNTYDDQGHMTKTSAYQGRDRLVTEISYDTTGAVTARVEYKYNGDAHTYMLTYDASGKLAEEFDYKAADKLTPNRWTYTYDDAGNFLYKEGQVAAIAWDWSTKRVTLGNYYAYPVLLAQTIPNCVSFTLDYKMYDVSYGNPYGKQNIYIQTDAGSWKKVGTLD